MWKFPDFNVLHAVNPKTIRVICVVPLYGVVANTTNGIHSPFQITRQKIKLRKSAWQRVCSFRQRRFVTIYKTRVASTKQFQLSAGALAGRTIASRIYIEAENDPRTT